MFWGLGSTRGYNGLAELRGEAPPLAQDEKPYPVWSQAGQGGPHRPHWGLPAASILTSNSGLVFIFMQHLFYAF